jgi:hypothetical protein
MDEFAYFHQADLATLIHVVLFAMFWVCSIVAIDRWVSARRPDLHRTIGGSSSG